MYAATRFIVFKVTDNTKRRFFDFNKCIIFPIFCHTDVTHVTSFMTQAQMIKDIVELMILKCHTDTFIW